MSPGNLSDVGIKRGADRGQCAVTSIRRGRVLKLAEHEALGVFAWDERDDVE